MDGEQERGGGDDEREGEERGAGPAEPEWASRELAALHNAVVVAREALTEDSAATLTVEERGRLGDARNEANDAKVELEVTLKAEDQQETSALSAKQTTEWRAQQSPLVEARRGQLEGRIEKIMRPVVDLQSREKTRARAQDELSHAEKFWREALAGVSARQGEGKGAGSGGERGGAENKRGSVNPKRGERPNEHNKPDSPSVSELEKKRSREDSEGQSDGEDKDGDEFEHGDGVAALKPGVAALVARAAAAAVRAAADPWEQERRSKEFGRQGEGNGGGRGVKNVLGMGKPLTYNQSADKDEYPPEAERIVRATLLRAGLPEEFIASVLAEELGGAGRSHAHENEPGTASIAAVLLDKGDIAATAQGGDGVEQMLAVMSATGMTKQSVSKSPQAFESAVYALNNKFMQAIRGLDAAAQQLGGFGGEVVLKVMRISQKLTKEAGGMVFILEKWHKELVARLVHSGYSASDAHSHAVLALRESAQWKARSYAGPPTALHSLAHAAHVGVGGGSAGGGGQQRQLTDAAFRVEMLSAVKAAVAGAVAGAAPGARRGREVNDGLCRNCSQPGHKFYECPNAAVCRVCKKPGHKQGDAACLGK